MVRKDGSTVWVLDEATLIRPENGAPYWQGFQLDITGRKEAEQRLQDAHEHLRVMVDSTLDAVVSMDVDGVITAWNPQAETTFGWSAEEVVGRSLIETIVPHAHRAAHSEGLRRWRETGEGPVLNARIEIQGLHRDGRGRSRWNWRSSRSRSGRRRASRDSSATSATGSAHRRIWSGPSRSSGRQRSDSAPWTR